MKISEKKIQAEVLQWLKDNGIFHWRQNSGLAFIRSGSSTRAILLGPHGFPDIFAVRIGGLLVGLEVKSATGKQSPKQKEIQAALESIAAEYYLVRSVEDVKRIWGAV